ncbi:hypothetical protein APS14_28285 [Pseudomonas thivervalensis]|nr:hypothetical protein APS14_28285 [Pseudomonas thivervalensis]
MSGFAAAAQPSGSKLPRHGVVWACVIASKLAPTGDWGGAETVFTTVRGGRGLARDSYLAEMTVFLKQLDWQALVGAGRSCRVKRGCDLLILIFHS